MDFQCLFRPCKVPTPRVARHLSSGYLSRKRNPPPGNMMIWHSLTRLMDIHRDCCITVKFVGNRKLAVHFLAGRLIGTISSAE